MMNTFGMRFSSTIFAFATAACNTAQADTMGAAELRKLAPGTFHVSVANKVKLTVVLKANGAVSGTTDKGDHDTGRWSIRGDKFCVVFKRWLDHKLQCESLIDEGYQWRGSVFTIKR